MNIELPEDLKCYVQSEVLCGHFASEQDAIEEAVRLLSQRSRQNVIQPTLLTQEQLESQLNAIWFLREYSTAPNATNPRGEFQPVLIQGESLSETVIHEPDKWASIFSTPVASSNVTYRKPALSGCNTFASRQRATRSTCAYRRHRGNLCHCPPPLHRPFDCESVSHRPRSVLSGSHTGLPHRRNHGTLVQDAIRLADSHSLRANDALQLAAFAHLQANWTAHNLGQIAMVSADLELNAAAHAMKLL